MSISIKKIRIIIIILVTWSSWFLETAVGRIEVGAGRTITELLLGTQDYHIKLETCGEFTDDPKTCRERGCVYNCANGLCNKAHSNCGLVSGCAENCFDICGCRKQGCHFNYGNSQCRNYTDITCRFSQFYPIECGRKDTHYSVGGEICHNKQQHGSCTLEQVILAVNLQGGEHIDSNGISYQAYNAVEMLDPHKITANASSREFQGRPLSDRPLYTTILTGNARAEPGQCVSFMVPICQDGVYELGIKLIESSVKGPGLRHFNIKFANQYVFPEVDLYTLADGKFKAVDLNINFIVSQGQLALRGFESVSIMDKGGHIPLEFCIGECSLSHIQKFSVSAFSVIRFKNDNGFDSGTNYC